MYPRGGACTVSVAYPTYGFAAEKDIPKVVSDGEINPKLHTFATAEAIRAKRRQILL